MNRIVLEVKDHVLLEQHGERAFVVVELNAGEPIQTTTSLLSGAHAAHEWNEFLKIKVRDALAQGWR